MEASESGQQGGRILLIDDDPDLAPDRAGPPPPRAGAERLAATP